MILPQVPMKWVNYIYDQDLNSHKVSHQITQDLGTKGLHLRCIDFGTSELNRYGQRLVEDMSIAGDAGKVPYFGP